MEEEKPFMRGLAEERAEDRKERLRIEENETNQRVLADINQRWGSSKNIQPVTDRVLREIRKKA